MALTMASLDVLAGPWSAGIGLLMMDVDVDDTHERTF